MPLEPGACEKELPLRDGALRKTDTAYRDLAVADSLAFSLCWGERLLLRVADQELNGIKGRTEKELLPLTPVF